MNESDFRPDFPPGQALYAVQKLRRKPSLLKTACKPSTALSLPVSVESPLANLSLILSDPAVLDQFQFLEHIVFSLTSLPNLLLLGKSFLCPDNSCSLFRS